MRRKANMLLSATVAGLAGVALAQHADADPANPGKGPPDCPGTPGALISDEALALVEEGTPPGQVVQDRAKGQGVGETVRSALRDACGIGALPPAEDSGR